MVYLYKSKDYCFVSGFTAAFYMNMTAGMRSIITIGNCIPNMICLKLEKNIFQKPLVLLKRFTGRNCILSFVKVAFQRLKTIFPKVSDAKLKK